MDFLQIWFIHEKNITCKYLNMVQPKESLFILLLNPISHSKGHMWPTFLSSDVQKVF